MFVVAEGITIPLFIFIIGFCFIHYGMEFGNQAIDYVEDKASDVKTPPVRWGMIPSIQIALFCVVIGIAIEASSLYFILLSKGSFTFIHPFLTTEVVYMGLLAIIAAGYYIPTKGLWRMLITLKESDTVEEGMPTLKRICNYARWQTSGILGVAVVSAIMFFGVVFGPVSTMTPKNEGAIDIIEDDLMIATYPDIEFYTDNTGCHANVSISVLNDDVPRHMGSMMVTIESFVANFQITVESNILERDLAPYEYWNTSTTIRAHDIDDTSIKVSLFALINQNGLNVMHESDALTVNSQKNLYIYDAEPTFYEEYHDKKVNVSVKVFNGGNTKSIGDLEVEIFSYTSYWFYTGSGSVKNNVTLKSNEHWIAEVYEMNILELDYDDPIFIIHLKYNDEVIDEYTLEGPY
jgi:hypothetical protein